MPPLPVQEHLKVMDCSIPGKNCVILKKYKNILRDLPVVVENTLDGKVLLSKPWAYTGSSS